MQLSYVLSELKVQLRTAEQQLTREPSLGSLERAALALRKCLEGVALTSLVVNGPLLERAEKSLMRLDAADAIKSVRRINPGFWPHPQDVSVSAKAGIRIEASGDVVGELRLEDYGRAIGQTSDWLHWRNPLVTPLSVEDGHENLHYVFLKLERLLRSFTLTLPGDTELILCSINFGRSGDRTMDAPATAVRLTREEASVG